MKVSKVYELLSDGQHGQSELYCKLYPDEYVITSLKGKEGYYYNEDKKLWVELSESMLINHLSKNLKKQCDICIDFFNKSSKNLDDNDDDEKISKFKKNITLLRKLKLSLSQSRHLKGIIDFLLEHYKNNEFMNSLNSSKFKLPIRGGNVINLKTLEVRERRKTDLFSYELDLDIIKKYDNATKYFLDLMTGDKEKMKTFQDYLGYSITGESNLKCFFVGIGCGDNGKSKCFEIMNKLFTPFMEAVDKTILFKEKTNKDNASYLAKLCGKRIGMYNEPSDNCELKEDVIKSITGNDMIIAKPLYRDPFNFIPIIKIWMLTNKTVKFDACSEPMVKRANIIKFKSVFTDNEKLLTKKGYYKKDNRLIDNLMNKWRDEFFTFVVIGANRYYKNDRQIFKSSSLIDEEVEYLKCIDPIRSFIDLKCVSSDNGKISRVELFEAYIEWCKQTDNKMVKRDVFYERIRTLKFEAVKIKGYDFFKGIELKVYKDNYIDENDEIDGKQILKEEEGDTEEAKKIKLKKKVEVESDNDDDDDYVSNNNSDSDSDSDDEFDFNSSGNKEDFTFKI